MNRVLISLGIAATVGIVAVTLMADGHEERHEYESHSPRDRNEDDADRGHAARSGYAYLSDAQFALYKNECGDCHMAYPPFTLPAASWKVMMASLEDHFGDNAELDASTAEEISNFLARHAAGKGRSEYGERTWRATRGGTAPLRITVSLTCFTL